MTCTRLESVGIHYIEVIGKNLKEVTFEDEPVVRMVSVKNKPQDENQLIVTEEIQGLWITREDKKLIAIQRGEVIVQ